MDKVLVTGGSGFLGKRLQRVKPNWIYISSNDYDLRNPDACAAMYKEISPDSVVHLAARVGGIKYNVENPATMYYENVAMNTNVIHQAFEAGIPRVLASLSTCSFPNKTKKYPFSEKDFFDGPPAEDNLSYGFSKRMLHVQCLSYRKQHGLDYSTFCPSNLYGPEDSFDPNNSHFISAMIKKMHEAEKDSTVEFWGSGNPLRQQLFVDDLAEIIPDLLDKHHTGKPLIVAPEQHLSIRSMILTFKGILNKNVKIEFNNELDGQFRKDGSNREFRALFPYYKFTPLKNGLEKTYNWYLNHGNV